MVSNLWGSRPLFILYLRYVLMKIPIIERIQKIAAQVSEENNVEYVHAELSGTGKKSVITVFIDKPDGVTHEDCARVSRTLENVLDAEDFIPSAYVLEVSSPGLERGLYNLRDFEKFVGSLAKVKIDKAVNDQKNFRGRIVRVENNEIIFEDKTSGVVRFDYGTVVKANLEINLSEELNGNEKRKTESDK